MALRERGGGPFPVTPEVGPLKCHAENFSHALVFEAGGLVTLGQRDPSVLNKNQG